MKKTLATLALALFAIAAKAQENKQSSLREYKHPAEFQEFLSFKTQWNENDTLPRPVYKRGTATVVGKIFGLPETANCKIIVSPH